MASPDGFSGFGESPRKTIRFDQLKKGRGMKLGIDLKVDYAFKWSFGNQAKIEKLRSFLEHILHDRLRGPIVEFWMT
jgi:hypothetical protein